MTIRVISGRGYGLTFPRNLPPRGRKRLAVPPGARVWALDVVLPASVADAAKTNPRAVMPRARYYATAMAESRYPRGQWRVSDSIATDNQTP